MKDARIELPQCKHCGSAHIIPGTPGETEMAVVLDMCGKIDSDHSFVFGEGSPMWFCGVCGKGVDDPDYLRQRIRTPQMDLHDSILDQIFHAYVPPTSQQYKALEGRLVLQAFVGGRNPFPSEAALIVFDDTGYMIIQPSGRRRIDDELAAKYRLELVRTFCQHWECLRSYLPDIHGPTFSIYQQRLKLLLHFTASMPAENEVQLHPVPSPGLTG